MTRPARFITFEGGEGTGKSTQARHLSVRLQEWGIACILTREPGGAPGAEEIRHLLVEGAPGRWDALTEMLMMFAARTEHVLRTIRPALDRGAWVLSDRFTDSTYAYQGAGRGLTAETIAEVERAVLSGWRPDLTLILDLPVEEGLRRAHSRHSAEDRYEKFDVGFHSKLRDFYRDLARREPERCVLIDAQGSETDVATQIWLTVADRFKI